MRAQGESVHQPTACESFARLLKQAASLPTQGHPIGAQLLAELEGSGHALLTTLLVREPLALLSVSGLPECCTALLTAAPPTDEWRRSALGALEDWRSSLAEGDTADALPTAIATATALLQQPPILPSHAEPAPPEADSNADTADAEAPGGNPTTEHT